MHRILAALVALLVSGTVLAQAWPNRPIRAVIPWPPGQATDLVGRVIAQKLTEVLGQPVVPDNRAGAGGMLGTEMAAKAPPDGYTILIASSGPVTINPLVQTKVPYDSEKDFVAVAKMGTSIYVLVTAPNFPAATAKDFVALVKANPGKYSFASSGTGATAHIIAEYFNMRTGITATHIPYKGSPPALTDVASGQVSYAIETVAATMPLVRGGKLKALGITQLKPTSLVPGVEPVATSLNLPGFDVGAWIGIMVATGTPKPIVDRLASVMASVMQQADVREKLTAVGLDVEYMASDEFGRFLSEQRRLFGDIVKRGNIKAD